MLRLGPGFDPELQRVNRPIISVPESMAVARLSGRIYVELRKAYQFRFTPHEFQTFRLILHGFRTSGDGREEESLQCFLRRVVECEGEEEYSWPDSDLDMDSESSGVSLSSQEDG